VLKLACKQFVFVDLPHGTTQDEREMADSSSIIGKTISHCRIGEKLRNGGVGVVLQRQQAPAKYRHINYWDRLLLVIPSHRSFENSSSASC
jgi:hypothetical protein